MGGNAGDRAIRSEYYLKLEHLWYWEPEATIILMIFSQEFTYSEIFDQFGVISPRHSSWIKLTLGLAHWRSFFTYFQTLPFQKYFSTVMTSLYVVTWAEGRGLRVVFWWNSNICKLRILGPLIFWKIALKYTRCTLGSARLQNFDHVTPLHGYWKKSDVISIYMRHFLNLFPATRSDTKYDLYFLHVKTSIRLRVKIWNLRLSTIWMSSLIISKFSLFLNEIHPPRNF